MKRKVVTVHVPGNLTLEQSQKVLAAVLGKAGHPNCYSGLQVSFESVVDPENLVLMVEKGLAVRGVGE